MVIADIFSKINMGSVTTNDNGSGLDVTRITRKSVFVQLLADSGATINIESSPNDSEWFNLDSKTYASGTNLQTDIFSYNSHFPWMRTTLTGKEDSVTASTTITGRGV